MRVKPEIEPNLGIGLVVVLLRSKPPRNHLIFDSVCQSEVVVSIRRHISVLYHLVVQMSINCLLHTADRSLFGDFGYTDAPAILRI